MIYGESVLIYSVYGFLVFLGIVFLSFQKWFPKNLLKLLKLTCAAVLLTIAGYLQFLKNELIISKILLIMSCIVVAEVSLERSDAMYKYQKDEQRIQTKKILSLFGKIVLLGIFFTGFWYLFGIKNTAFVIGAILIVIFVTATANKKALAEANGQRTFSEGEIS